MKDKLNEPVKPIEGNNVYLVYIKGVLEIQTAPLLKLELNGKSVTSDELIEEISSIPSLKKQIEELEKENKEFAEWCSKNKWQMVYNQGSYKWLQIPFETIEYKTTTELIDIFRSVKEKENELLRKSR